MQRIDQKFTHLQLQLLRIAAKLLMRSELNQFDSDRQHQRNLAAVLLNRVYWEMPDTVRFGKQYLDEAARCLLNIIRTILAETESVALLRRADQLLMNGDHVEASRSYHTIDLQLLQSCDSVLCCQVHFNAGLCDLFLQRFDTARQHFNMAHLFNSENNSSSSMEIRWKIEIGRVVSLVELKQFDDALQLLLDLIAEANSCSHSLQPAEMLYLLYTTAHCRRRLQTDQSTPYFREEPGKNEENLPALQQLQLSCDPNETGTPLQSYQRHFGHQAHVDGNAVDKHLAQYVRDESEILSPHSLASLQKRRELVESLVRSEESLRTLSSIIQIPPSNQADSTTSFPQSVGLVLTTGDADDEVSMQGSGPMLCHPSTFGIGKPTPAKRFPSMTFFNTEATPTGRNDNRKMGAAPSVHLMKDLPKIDDTRDRSICPSHESIRSPSLPLPSDYSVRYQQPAHLSEQQEYQKDSRISGLLPRKSNVQYATREDDSRNRAPSLGRRGSLRAYHQNGISSESTSDECRSTDERTDLSKRADESLQVAPVDSETLRVLPPANSGGNYTSDQQFIMQQSYKKSTEQCTMASSGNSSITNGTTGSGSFDKPHYFLVEELIAPGPYPDGVDVRHREMYLNDSDFTAVFGMNKSDWTLLPVWKQRIEKQRTGLF